MGKKATCESGEMPGMKKPKYQHWKKGVIKKENCWGRMGGKGKREKKSEK